MNWTRRRIGGGRGGGVEEEEKEEKEVEWELEPVADDICREEETEKG